MYPSCINCGSCEHFTPNCHCAPTYCYQCGGTGHLFIFCQGQFQIDHGIDDSLEENIRAEHTGENLASSPYLPYTNHALGHQGGIGSPTPACYSANIWIDFLPPELNVAGIMARLVEQGRQLQDFRAQLQGLQTQQSESRQMPDSAAPTSSIKDVPNTSTRGVGPRNQPIPAAPPSISTTSTTRKQKRAAFNGRRQQILREIRQQNLGLRGKAAKRLATQLAGQHDQHITQTQIQLAMPWRFAQEQSSNENNSQTPTQKATHIVSPNIDQNVGYTILQSACPNASGNPVESFSQVTSQNATTRAAARPAKASGAIATANYDNSGVVIKMDASDSDVGSVCGSRNLAILQKEMKNFNWVGYPPSFDEYTCYKQGIPSRGEDGVQVKQEVGEDWASSWTDKGNTEWPMAQIKKEIED